MQRIVQGYSFNAFDNAKFITDFCLPQYISVELRIFITIARNNETVFMNAFMCIRQACN